MFEKVSKVAFTFSWKKWFKTHGISFVKRAKSEIKEKYFNFHDSLPKLEFKKQWLLLMFYSYKAQNNWIWNFSCLLCAENSENIINEILWFAPIIKIRAPKHQKPEKLLGLCTKLILDIFRTVNLEKGYKTMRHEF